MTKKTNLIQTFNYLVAGRQRTGKTSASLVLIGLLQYMAYKFGKPKRVLIFNPDNQNPVFESKSLINDEIRHGFPDWKFPAKLRKIQHKDIVRVANEKDNLYDWCVISDCTLEEFSNEAVKLRDCIIYFDDMNNIITGNISGKRYESTLEIFAGNRKRGNETIITYHTYAQVPNKLWTYFQRAIIKETDDDNEDFKKIKKAKAVLIEAQKQVRAENKLKKNPDDLDFAERIVWLNEQYLFNQQGNNLVCKIGQKYYKAVGDKIEAL